ncbi:sigma-70 family RNA polymerase sigma factor [Planctomicrobium piriforme]|uniref:RNA polymerase primary sigma factor n=1 Tax=Planctomicrobium piriforme TaxID=1576369 RepID=A0A1I3KQL1_9PLAN|nr:sigma-70 family RNA polymerase sigma factor [Planctomicrobium piriforme]SFI74789.1 RNA polymerase primary sigma factor [Planctomicrobium piriforme]
MTTKYQNPAIKQLTEQQKRYAPLDKRVEQMDRAEALLTQLEPAKSYRYPELCEAITGFRTDKYPDLILTSDELQHDIPLFVEELSASLDLPVEKAGEPVLTVDDLSEKFKVSTKTVDRWRKRGLVSRRFKFGNRSRVGFLRSSVDRFVSDHGTEIERGSRFTQLSEAERLEIVTKARRLARHGACPAEVGKRLSRWFNRSPETIRYTLKQYDAEHPENAVFPTASSPLTNDRKQEIYQKFVNGMSVDALSEEFCRTRTSVYRIVSDVRAELLLNSPIDYMDSAEFHRPDAERLILGPAPQVEKKSGAVKAPPGLPPYLASLYTVPLLTREEEGHFFRKMNYLKFKAAQLQKQVDGRRPKTKELDEIESLVERATEVKNFLIRSNLRLVVSIAKRHMKPTANFFEMVSDGNMSLIRAIEKFDYTKGNKFSTYASWAIMKNYARSIPAEHRVLDRFRTGSEEIFKFSEDGRGSQFADESANSRQHQMIMSILDHLDDRERAIIMHRYGLERGSEPETLEQVGSRFNVTKERIRQIESRAMQKIRKIASEEKLDIPGF